MSSMLLRGRRSAILGEILSSARCSSYRRSQAPTYSCLIKHTLQRRRVQLNPAHLKVTTLELAWGRVTGLSLMSRLGL